MNTSSLSTLEAYDHPFGRLQSLVRVLRGPDGCPWDKKQTATSLIKYLREETEELIEAIESGKVVNICEESGDVFFILTLLAAVYDEQGLFSAEDALDVIYKKMIRRHPHVFESKKQYSEEELQQSWDKIKAEEKKQRKPSVNDVS